MDKKKFYKKKWMQEQYNNRHKVQQWEAKQEKCAFNKYRKELKKMNIPITDKKKTEITNLPKKNDFHSAKDAYEQWRKERQSNKEQKLKKRSEIQHALETYKLKKKLKYKQLLKKTQKGQPIMKGRMEMLLKQIQASVKKR